MSEPAPTYNAGRDSVVRCSHCHAVMGDLVILPNGQEWLVIGGVLSRSVHGVCKFCGETFHWTVADQALSELIRHVLVARNQV